MTRAQLVDMIYEELFNELHKKGHKDPKGRKLMKGEEDLDEAINKSDAKYTMKMMFDNHGFGKALKHMKILRRGITLNMSSYMGPGKVLNKIVKDFNDVMGTKYKIDADSFQKGHVTSIELKEGKLTEDYSQRKRNFTAELRKKMELAKNGTTMKIGKHSWTKVKNNWKGGKYNRTEPHQLLIPAITDDMYTDIKNSRDYNAADVISKIKFESKVHEMSATARKHGKFGSTGVPFPTEKPNEFAYMDFAKYIKKNEKKVIKFLKQIRPDAIFKALQDFWSGWDRKTNNSAFSNIRGNKFGRELALMLRKDGLVFKNTGNKITNLKETSNVWKRFDAMQKLRGNIMDVEDEMRDITNDLKQLHMDMEQEAEPGGGRIADRYGRDIEKKEKEYKKKKAEFKKLVKQLDKLEQF